MTDIKSMNLEEMKSLMAELGEKPFRAKQIYSWLHEHLVTSWNEMTNLSRGLREKLKEYPVTALEVVDVQTSRLDGTQKYLFRLSDGNVIESVLMRYKHGNSVCISSQDAAWDVVSALLRSEDLPDVCFPQKCWTRFIVFRL